MGGRHNYSDKNKSSYDRSRHHHYHHAEHDERDRRHHDRDSDRERYHKSSRDSSEHKHHHTSYKRRAHDEYDHHAKRPRYDRYEEHHESNRKSKEFIERKDFKKSLMENRTKNSNAFQAKSSNIPSPYAHLPPSPPRLKRPTQPISLNMAAESADIGSDFAPKKEEAPIDSNTIEKTADSHETNSTKNQVADSSSYAGNIEELEHRREMKKATSTYRGQHQNVHAQNKHAKTYETNEPNKDIAVSKNKNTGKIHTVSADVSSGLIKEKLNRSRQIPIKNELRTHYIENTTEKDSHKNTGNVVSKWSKTFDQLKTNDDRTQSNFTPIEENKVKNTTAGNESCNKNTGILKGPFTTSTSGSNTFKTAFMANFPTKQTNTPKENQFFKNTGFSKQAPMNSNSCMQQLHHEKDKTNRDNSENNNSNKNTGTINERNLKYANKDNSNMNIQPQENNENTGNFAQPHTSRQSQYLKNTGYSNHISKKSNSCAQQLQDDGEKTNRNNKDFKKNTGKIIEAAIESNLKYTNKVNPNIDIQALENNGKQHNENTGKFSHTNILNKVAPPYVNKAQCDDGKNSNSKSDTSNFNAPNKNTGSFSKKSSAKFTSQCRITQAENHENMCNKSSFNSSLNPDPGVVKLNSGHFPPNVIKFNGHTHEENLNSNLNKNTGIPHMHRHEKPDVPMSQTPSKMYQNDSNDASNSANNFILKFSKNTGIPPISYNDKAHVNMNQSPSKLNQNNGSMANNLPNTGNFIPPNMRFYKPPPVYGLPKMSNEENPFKNQFGNFQNQQNTGINPTNFPPNFNQPPPILIGNMEFRYSQEGNATNSNRNNFENTINQNNGNYTGFYKRPPAYGNNTQNTGINYRNLKGNQNNGNFTGSVVRQNTGNFFKNPHEYNFPSPHGYNVHITSQPHRYDENNPRNVEINKDTVNFSNNKNSICNVPAPYKHKRGHNMPAIQSPNEMNKHFTNNTGNINNNKNTGNRMENNNNTNWEQTTNQIRSSNEIANRIDKNLKNTGDFFKENIRLEDNNAENSEQYKNSNYSNLPTSYEANKNTGNNDICGNKTNSGPPEGVANLEKENTNLMTINNQNPFDDKLLQTVQFDVTVPPPPLNGNENGKYSKNIQFGMRRRTNIRLVDHKMDRHFGIKKQFSKFGNKEITKYPVRRGFNTQQIAKSNDNTFQINPSFGGNQRFYEDINPAPPVENENPANNIQNNNNGGQQLRQNHQRYSNHNPRMKPFDNRNGRPPFKYQHLQKPLPGIGKFNQRGFINRAPSVRGRLVQRGNRKPIPLLKSSLKHNFQKKLPRTATGAQNKFAKKLTKSKLKTTKTEKKKSKKTKIKPKDTCTDQETAGDDHIDINKQVFGDFKPIQVNGKKPAKGHLKPDPEEYWKQWWSLYGYVEHSIAPVDRNDPTVASVLDFQLTPNDKEFRKRKRVLLTMGVAKILKHIRINETDYALRDIFNVLKYRHQLEDSKFQQYLSTKEMQRLEMVLKNARKKTRRAFFYQSMICRWHFSTQIVQRAESGEQLKVGHARKLLANKVFLYFVCESIQELKKLIIEDWPGFEEYYNSLQST